MARQRLSGREMAVRMGRPSNTIGRWMRGETPVGLDEIELFAEALGVSGIDWIAKAFSSERGPDDAVNSDCTTRRSVRRPGRFALVRLVKAESSSFVHAA